MCWHTNVRTEHDPGLGEGFAFNSAKLAFALIVSHHFARNNAIWSSRIGRDTDSWSIDLPVRIQLNGDDVAP